MDSTAEVPTSLDVKRRKTLDIADDHQTHLMKGQHGTLSSSDSIPVVGMAAIYSQDKEREKVKEIATLPGQRVFLPDTNQLLPESPSSSFQSDAFVPRTALPPSPARVRGWPIIGYPMMPLTKSPLIGMPDTRTFDSLTPSSDLRRVKSDGDAPIRLAELAVCYPFAASRRGKLPKATTDLLKDWIYRHSGHPYPSETENKELCTATGLSMSQITNWMINVSSSTATAF